MAINKVVYDGSTLIDLTDTTAVASDVAQGKYFYTAQGVKTAGTASGSTTPNGIKYVWAETDDVFAPNVTNYEYCSINGMPIGDNHWRVWLDLTDIISEFTVSGSFRYNRTQGTVHVNWGDGQVETISSSSFTANYSHTYTEPGLYVVDVTFVSGTVGVYSLNTGAKQKSIFAEVSRADTGSAPTFGSAIASNASQTIQYVYYSDSIGNLGNAAFEYSSIRKVRLSANTTKIPVSCFEFCSNLEEISIPNGTTTIGQSAFRECASLTSIIIPISITSIGNTAFDGCTGVKEYHILPETPPTLGTRVFQRIPSDCIIYVPSASLSDYQTATNWSNYASYMQEEPS